MPRKRLFITGGSGLLGLNWAQQCKADHDVFIGINNRKAALGGVSSVGVELLNASALQKALDRIQPDLVIHAAGLTNVETCERDPARAKRENTDLAGAVAEAAAKQGAALVHISTDHLHSGRADIYDEEDPVAPVNVYAATKAAAEDVVDSKHPGALIIRTNFYGWGPGYRPSFSDWLISKFRAGEQVPLFTDVVYTPILMKALIDAAMDLSAIGAKGVFNVCADEPMTKYDFGADLAKIFDFSQDLITPAGLSQMKGLVQRPNHMSLSNQKMQRILGRGTGALEEQLSILREQEHDPLIKEIRTL